eukprot:scaffold1101_cov123-Cylindrotheca_fusiformis.AAC.8
MGSCVASSTRAVVSTCRIGKSRTVQSAQFHSVPSIQASGSKGCLLGSQVISPARVFNTGAPKWFAPLSIEVQKEREMGASSLVLSSAILLFSFAFITGGTTNGSDSLPAPSNSETKLSPNGQNSGGGGFSKPLAATTNGEKNAEEDVRRLEEEAARDPYEVSIEALQGARWTMEDAYSIENGGRFVAVFDGHGGSEVSSMLRDRLYDLYRKLLNEKHCKEMGDSYSVPRRVPSASSHAGAIKGALEEIETNVLIQEDLVYQGSTAVAVIIHTKDNGERALLAANIGDSRAVLSRKSQAVELTRDHKPNDEREVARIRALGEDVEWDPYGQLFRVRDLSLSRAIGDRFAKPAVSSEAEIKYFPLSEGEDEFIILASDGLWDVMSSQEAVDYIHRSLLNPSSIDGKRNKNISRSTVARKVANEALERGSADNVCVLVVWLRDEAAKA